MRCYVNGHRDLENEEVLRVEGAEAEQQTHGPAPVSEHVEHATEFGT